MNADDWKVLTKRFPRVPQNFEMETVATPTPAGKPLPFGERPVIALAFSADSTSLAASGGGMIPGRAAVRVFDIATRELRRVGHAHSMGVFALAFDPRTGLLASASHDYSVILWELEQKDSIFLVGDANAGSSRRAARFLGSRVLVADGMTFGDHRAQLTAIDLETGKHAVWFEAKPGHGISYFDVLPDQSLVVASVTDTRAFGAVDLHFFDAQGKALQRIAFERSLYDLVAANPHTLVGTASNQDDVTEVFTLDAKTGARRVTRALSREIGANLAMSPDRTRVAVAHAGAVELCALDSLEPQKRLTLDGMKACSVAWSPDGRWLAVGTVQRLIQLFEV